jgi:hypothetical protein
MSVGIAAIPNTMGVALTLIGSSSISVHPFAAFAGQDAGLATLLALRAWALRCCHRTGQKFMIH